MDRKESINEIFERISPKRDFYDDRHMNLLLNGIAGFMPATDGTDNAMLISNIAYIFAQSGFNTCVVDLKVFYPNLYNYLDVAPNKKSRGLLNVLKSDKIDIRNEINLTKYEKIYLLSPSPQDLMEEYFDFELSDVKSLLTRLKSIFDVVLVDIPNIPPLEFCIGAIENCSIGFFTASERLDAVNNMIRALDFASTLGVSTAKFANVIFMNVQHGEYDFSVVKNMKFNIVAQLPAIKATITDSYEGKLYIRDNTLVNKNFSDQLESIVQLIVSQG